MEGRPGPKRSSARISLPYSWVLWELEWRYSLPPANTNWLVRATDDKGRTQPSERATDRADGYEVQLPISGSR